MQVRFGLIVVGLLTLLQAFLPWTNSIADRLPFFGYGAILLVGAWSYGRVFPAKARAKVQVRHARV